MLIIFIFLVGLCLGSFLNVCIYRLPLSKSIIKPRSFCPNCNSPIPWYDNIPLLSYLFLKRRCRYCKEKIPFRYFLVELLTGVILVVLYLYFNSIILVFSYTFLVAGLIIATFTDIIHRIIPDKVNIGCLIIGLGLSFCFPQLHDTMIHWKGILFSSIGALVGGGTIFVLGLLGKLIFKKESMGGGDVKLLAMAGSYLGWKLILLTFFIAPFFGSIFGIIKKIVSEDEYIPYGPFLALGCVVSLFWGEEILRWLLVRPY